MGQIIVRNLDDNVIERLKQRARSAGKSLEQTARDVLTASTAPSREELIAFASEMRGRTAQRGADLDVVAAIRSDRDSDHAHEWR
jgi:plasmid stability protein